MKAVQYLGLLLISNSDFRSCESPLDALKISHSERRRAELPADCNEQTQQRTVLNLVVARRADFEKACSGGKTMRITRCDNKFKSTQESNQA